MQEGVKKYMLQSELLEYLASGVKVRGYASSRPRDEHGKILIDLAHPHVLKDMKYFTEARDRFLATGCYCPYGRSAVERQTQQYKDWYREEVRRCLDGYIREKDGEWITGDYYYYLNYTQLLKIAKVGNRSVRVYSFPDIIDGQYWRFHYLQKCIDNGKHAIELARRGCGKTYSTAALLTKRFFLGERKSFDDDEQRLYNRGNACISVAKDSSKLIGVDMVLDRFRDNLDFGITHAGFPRLLSTDSKEKMIWELGYRDKATGAISGLKNTVIGVSANKNLSVLRGARGILYVFEEAGSFNGLDTLWTTQLEGVEDGGEAFGLMYAIGTAGDTNEGFESLGNMFTNPATFKIYEMPNFYERGLSEYSGFFFPAYIGRNGFVDKDGNSDVVGAMEDILANRERVKKDDKVLTLTIQENPILPSEAMIVKDKSYYSCTELFNRLVELKGLPPNQYQGKFHDIVRNDTHATLVEPRFRPVVSFPFKAPECGCVEIFKEYNPNNRYIIGFDPVDHKGKKGSLASALVMELETREIAAEATFRRKFPEQGYDLVAGLSIYYNCQIVHENNLAGTETYFRQHNLLKKLYCKDGTYGIRTSDTTKELAIELITSWIHLDNGAGVKMIDRIRSIPMLQELIAARDGVNTDRLSALSMILIYLSINVRPTVSHTDRYAKLGLENINKIRL